MIAGGGTAGHVQPGIEIARALVARGHPAGTIHFVGSSRGIEARLVPAAGFGLTQLPGRGIVRRLTPESVAGNLAALAGLGRAGAMALSLVRRRRPAVVVALGGYASVPCAAAAVTLGVPVVVVEQNAVPGAANRLVARFAKASAVSFPGTDLPRAEVTGNPVRPEILAVDRRGGRGAARAALDLPGDRRVLGVFGGSLGARRLNLAMVGALGVWAERSDLAVRHVVGERDWDLVTDALADLPTLPDGGVVYQQVRYEERMDLLMTAADLLVGRAGGTTVAELAAVGLPSVLVPLPIAPGDHQTANGRALERAGAAVVVPDAEFDGPRLVAEVDRLMGDPARLEAMAVAAAGCARRDAADRVAALVERYARS